MFTKLHVENLLSLRNVDIELGKVNVFIGPNASGKSNIAKAFQLIAEHAREGLPILKGYRYLRELSFNFNPAVDIRLSLKKPVENKDCEFSLQLTNESYIEVVWIAGEEIITHRGIDSTVFIKGLERPLTSYVEGGYYGRRAYRSILTSLPSDIDVEIHQLASDLRKISVHSFAPDRLRLINPVSEKSLLEYHGGNLARHLLYLYTERRKDFGRVEETLKSMIPEIEEVIPHIEGADVEIWVKVKDVDEPLKPHNISDGTLRLLAMIITLYGGSSLVVLEEPENCVHPYLLEAFMNLVRDSPSQVLITTHSPYLLDHVKPDEVYIVGKEGIETKVKKLSTAKEMESVKLFLEEGGTLGEAWYSGIIGGTV